MARLAFMTLLALALAAACGGGGSTPETSEGGRLVLTRMEGIAEFSLGGGSERIILPQVPDTTALDLAVSPDGSRIAFARQLTPVVVPGQSPDFGSDVLLVNSDGSGEEVLIEHGSADELIRSPLWLPGGDEIIVSVNRFEGGFVLSTLERFHIPTGDRTPIIENAYQADISPDGTQLVYIRTEEDFSQTLWVANVDGSDARRIAGMEDNLVSFYAPAFSPDGGSIAFGAAEPIEATPQPFTSRRGGAPSLRAQQAPLANGLPANILLLDLNSDGPPRIIGQLGLDQPSLTWRPDGTLVYVLASTGLYAVDAFGDTLVPPRLGEGTFHGYVDWLGE